MTTTQGARAGRSVILALLASTLVVGRAEAVGSSTRPGSILIFPKVVTTGGRDTLIHITNTGNMANSVRCFYVNGESCVGSDFYLSLTRQQPTAWQAGEGRPFSLRDEQPGLDPGPVPPIPTDYAGALVCVEVDPSDDGAPMVRNQLKGEATIIDGAGGLTQGNVGKYNAVALAGKSGTDDSALDLDEDEYEACPAALQLNFQKPGEDGTIAEFGNGGLCGDGAPCATDSDCVSPDPQNQTCTTRLSRQTTRLTVVPCTLDLERLTKTTAALTFQGRDETEAPISGSRRFSCWDSFDVEDIFGDSLLTPFNTVSVWGTDPASPIAAPKAVPVVAVSETFYSDSLGNTASALVNLHGLGRCNAATSSDGYGGLPCTRDSDCTKPGTAITLGVCVQGAVGTITLSAP